MTQKTNKGLMNYRRPKRINKIEIKAVDTTN